MGLNNNVLHTIRQQMPQFSKGQKRIAAYILEHYDKAAFMTASRLGQTVEVSESTVVRFAAQLGYEGYPEMQRDLRELIRGKLTSIQRIQVSNDQMQGDLLTSVMQRDMDSLRTAIEQVDRGQFEQLVQVQPGDVLLAISFPRYSKMTVNAVQYAREKGADVVAITDSTLAPLYPLASAALLVRSDMISFVDSITAPLSLLNALIVTVGQRKNEEVPETFSELERVWSQYSVFGKTEDE